MGLTARNVLATVLLTAIVAPRAAAQLGDEIPHAPYYSAVEAIYLGDYRVAEKELRRETQRGVRTPQTRWIDSICYHAMLGEVLYHEGRNSEALTEFDQACQLLLAYPDFLLQVKFQPVMRPDPNRARRAPPWGRSQRSFAFGQFPTTEQILIGDLNSERAFREGGVARLPMFWRVNVMEVVRSAALAIRRRSELLGPLAKHDAISKELIAALSRGNLAPVNHWSQAWIDLLHGVALAGVGRLDEADRLIGRSLVLEGQFDHPLTCVGLYEQGHIAMLRGNGQAAGQLLAEAGFSAFYFENWDVLTEAALLGWINHLASGAAGVYPPLEPIAGWSQQNRMQHIATKLRLVEAESLLWLGQIDAGATLAADSARRIGEMRGGLPGINLLYVQAAVQMLQGQIENGGKLLMDAITAQAGASLRNFQIARINGMYDSRAASARIATDLYADLLADPTPAQWLHNPLDAMTVLQTPQDAAFDRWFLAALERKDAALALEIAERSKRRRFLSMQPFGGRFLALRALLEAPDAELSKEGILQRRQVLASIPAYQALAQAGQTVGDNLRGSPVIAPAPADAKALAALYGNWANNAGQRQLLLAQAAVRRVPSSMEFPPFRPTTELQAALSDGESLVAFHTSADSMYGFLVTNTDARIWQLPDARQTRNALGELLKALGNYGANRELSLTELQSDKWHDAAKKMYAGILENAKLDVAKTTSLIVVPDDLLWYVPFEVLIPDVGKPETTLADRFPVRYGPTAALAVSNSRPLRRSQHTAIVANELKWAGDDASTADVLKELTDVVAGPLLLPKNLPQPPHLLSPLFDGLIVLDDIAAGKTYGWSPLPVARGANDDAINSWFGLPYGGPEQIVATGFATEAEQGLKTSRRASKRAVRPGSEVFQSLCQWMAGGSRVILVTRWRTSGRTNFDLVREFAKELPQVPAAEAWQRACLLAREAPIDPAREPRLKRADETAEMPPANHPFFWAGYMLVDTGPRADVESEKPEPAKDDKDNGAKAANIPPPDKAPEPDAEKPKDAPNVDPPADSAPANEKQPADVNVENSN